MALTHYKLTYFSLRGAGEIIRQIFAVAGQDYEDHRIDREDWPNHKSEMPFGQMPVLEVDGKQLAQSYAIARYLANKFGLGGKTPFESAQVDSLADQFKDAQAEIRPFFLVLVGFAEGDLEKLKVDVLLPATKKFLPFFTNFLKASGSGFLVGDSLTWVDLLIAENINNLAAKVPEIFDGFPEIKAHRDKIHAIEAVKHWRETRPVTPF